MREDSNTLAACVDARYTEVVRKAGRADWSGSRGMMVVRPYGWARWEAIQRVFDDMIKESGHENWAFRLHIPREYPANAAETAQGPAHACTRGDRAGRGRAAPSRPRPGRPPPPRASASRRAE